VHQLVKDLNQLYLSEPALWQADFDTKGFAWIDALDHANSVLSFLRRGQSQTDELAVILNLTPVPRQRYRLGLPRAGKWLEIMNTDGAVYGGSNIGNMGGVTCDEIESHGQKQSAELTLPPLGIVVFKPEGVPVAKTGEFVEVPETTPKNPPTAQISGEAQIPKENQISEESKLPEGNQIPKGD
jgi:1,4-alpha-glucan branching enzyme